ncbi:MAG: penicillin-binding transpeptidase domain-containing protein [Candidatus Paceibacterota bacterium]
MFKKRKKDPSIYPDEIFMDSKNIPGFDVQQMEGKIERPISKRSFYGAVSVFLAIGLLFATKIFFLQAVHGEDYAKRSESNSLKKIFIIPNRGIIYDRNKEKLAWNDIDLRKYAEAGGFGHVLGYLGLPSEEDLANNKDAIREAVTGKNGIEKIYEKMLFGEAGVKISEVDSQNNVISESLQKQPEQGKDAILTIDSKIQAQLFNSIKSTAEERGFKGGAGIILDANNGEVLSLVSYPEYNSEILSKGEQKEKIKEFIGDTNKPFLNRAISGLYAPGSIIKPLIAIAALNEGVITPEKQIFSAGFISLPNPFFPDKKSIFKDWKAHGWVDMRRALAVSSDVYFYEVGGGFEGQKGLGIKKIEEYAEKFGFDLKTKIDLNGETNGTVPNAELKAKSSPEDPIWRIGDTYNASIGQGYFHVTPIEMAVYAAAVANSGKIIQPHLLRDNSKNNLQIIRDLNIPQNYFQVVHEGMRMGVTEGTASALNIWGVNIAAKTGTAEVGAAKKYVNSWIIGFWPYNNPKYAFALVMEKGPYANLVGAPAVMRQLLDWMSVNTPEYLK